MKGFKFNHSYILGLAVVVVALRSVVVVTAQRCTGLVGTAAALNQSDAATAMDTTLVVGIDCNEIVDDVPIQGFVVPEKMVWHVTENELIDGLSITMTPENAVIPYLQNKEVRFKYGNPALNWISGDIGIEITSPPGYFDAFIVQGLANEVDISLLQTNNITLQTMGISIKIVLISPGPVECTAQGNSDTIYLEAPSSASNMSITGGSNVLYVKGDVEHVLFQGVANSLYVDGRIETNNRLSIEGVENELLLVDNNSNQTCQDLPLLTIEGVGNNCTTSSLQQTLNEKDCTVSPAPIEFVCNIGSGSSSGWSPLAWSIYYYFLLPCASLLVSTSFF